LGPAGGKSSFGPISDIAKPRLSIERQALNKAAPQGAQRVDMC
jgi:hypothetical protein